VKTANLAALNFRKKFAVGVRRVRSYNVEKSHSASSAEFYDEECVRVGVAYYAFDVPVRCAFEF